MHMYLCTTKPCPVINRHKGHIWLCSQKPWCQIDGHFSNKLTSVFHVSVLLLIMNFVITLSFSSCGSRSGSADYFDNVMMKFMINNRTDAWKTDGNLSFTITRINYGWTELWFSVEKARARYIWCHFYVSVRLLTIKIRQWARKNFAVIVKNNISLPNNPNIPAV